jgi:hypothetical protein
MSDQSTVSPPLVDIDSITPDEELLAEVRKTRITTPFTRVLLVLLVLSVGFLAGALVDRWQRPASSSATSAQSLLAQFRSRRNGGGGTGATGSTGATGASGASGSSATTGFGSAASGATIGTVKLVDGKNVYVEDVQGDVVKVTTNADTTVTISKPGKVSQLEPGSTVIVQGKVSSDGSSMAATSISPSTGFGGGGFRGGIGAGGGGG